MLGIIGAQQSELALLTAEMKHPRVQSFGGLDFYLGTLASKDAVAVRSGVGKVNAALCAQILIDVFKADMLLNSGVAGAISPLLRPMDIVLATELVYHDMDATGLGYPPTEIPDMEGGSVFPTDPALLEAAQKAASTLGLKTHRGRIATGDQFITSTALKNRIRSICRPLAVEMEGAAVAHAARLHRVPSMVIRCISDCADESGKDAYRFNEQAAADHGAALVLEMIRTLEGNQ